MTPYDMIAVTRCRDPNTITKLLMHDYYDAPVRSFTKALYHAAGRWLARSKDVYFVVGYDASRPVAFALGHTLGPRLWRLFALSHIHLLPHVLWVMIVMRLGYESRRSHAQPMPGGNQSGTIALPTISGPFTWTQPNTATGYIEMIYVDNQFRGFGIATSLLVAAADEMRRDNLSRIEAHIDAENYASINAFLRAGWTVARTATKDCLAYCEINNAA